MLGHMGTPTKYPGRMSRAAFTPNDDQRNLLAALRLVHRKAAEAEAEYKRLLAECAEADIPIAKLAQELGIQRKTVYRHLGRSMT